MSESVAETFFGDKDPIGEILKINNENDVKVVGVYEDLPETTSFSSLELILPWDFISKYKLVDSRNGQSMG